MLAEPSGLSVGSNGDASGRAMLREISAQWIGVLGHPLRLQLIELLSVQPASVTALAGRMECSPAVVSKHLRALARVSVVARQQEGRAARYSLADPEVVRLVAVAYRISARDRHRRRSIGELRPVSQIGRSTSARG